MARMLCNFSLQVIIANCKNLVRQCSINSLHFHFKRILHISKPKTNAGIRNITKAAAEDEACHTVDFNITLTGFFLFFFQHLESIFHRIKHWNRPNPQSVNRAIKRIIADYNATEEVAAKKNTVKLFCYLISRRITCGTLFAQGFAKTKQTWKSSNRSCGTRTSKRLWMSTLKRLSRKSRNRLKDWLQNWTFFNRWRSALMGRSKWQQNHWMTANWQQTKGNKSVVWGMFD